VATKKKQKGRPTKLSEEKKQQAVKLQAKGMTIVEISEILAIHPRTLQRWRGKLTDFCHALKEAKDSSDELVKASLFRRATGYTCEEEKIFFFQGNVRRVKTIKHYPPDTTAAIFWLKNRQPQEWRDTYNIVPGANPNEKDAKKTFKQFCEDADYPAPYPKQEEMYRFGMFETEPRLLLGAPGYGKTDYVTIMGVAYDIYLDPTNSTNLLMTKSSERNADIVREVAEALRKNGVALEKQNSKLIRVAGLLGKESSLSTLTIRAASLRGRHPKRAIMEDVVTEDDSSESTRALARKKYSELLKRTQNVLVIGQPAHKADLYADLRPLLKKLEVPYGAIPELEIDLLALELAGVSHESISASYHLKVISETAAPFERVNYVDAFPKNGTAIAFIDPSFEGGDFTALTIAKSYFDGLAVKGRVWKRAWNHCIDDIVKELVACNVKRVAFETNSLGDQPIIMLRQALPEGIGVVGKKSTTHKHSRIMNAGAYAHLIWLAKNSDRAYLNQVTGYEYGVKNDDAPDSLASLLGWVGLVRER
jgi:transposase-like protein